MGGVGMRGTQRLQQKERGCEVPGCPASILAYVLLSQCSLLYVSLVRVVVDVLRLVWGGRRLRTFLNLSSSFPGDYFVATAGDLIHPDSVQNIQGDAGGDPCHLGAQTQPLKVWSAKGGEYTGPVRWHDSDAHQEEDHRHGNAV